MSQTLVPLASGSHDVVFELERFELTGEDRLELSGRWFGLRGRRFIRPTLTLVADGDKYRGLADLAHKPWAAEDGELWEAAFLCELGGAEVIDAELTVTSDITISLPAPSGNGGPRKTSKRPRRDRAAIAARQRAQAPESPRRTARPTEDDAALRRELGSVRNELAAKRTEATELRAQLDRVDTGRGEISERLAQLSADLETARRERDQVTAERDRVIAERDEAAAAAQIAERQRDSALKARDAMAAERDAAVDAKEQALSDRDTALRSRDVALDARDGALKARDKALDQREDAIDDRNRTEAELQTALESRARVAAERDAARKAHEQAIAERELLAQKTDRLQTQRAAESATRGAALVMRNAAINASGRRHPSWPVRVLTIVVLLAVIAAILIVTKII